MAGRVPAVGAVGDGHIAGRKLEELLAQVNSFGDLDGTSFGDTCRDHSIDEVGARRFLDIYHSRDYSQKPVYYDDHGDSANWHRVALELASDHDTDIYQVACWMLEADFPDRGTFITELKKAALVMAPDIYNDEGLEEQWVAAWKEFEEAMSNQPPVPDCHQPLIGPCGCQRGACEAHQCWWQACHERRQACHETRQACHERSGQVMPPSPLVDPWSGLVDPWSGQVMPPFPNL